MQLPISRDLYLVKGSLPVPAQAFFSRTDDQPHDAVSTKETSTYCLDWGSIYYSYEPAVGKEARVWSNPSSVSRASRKHKKVQQAA